VTRTAWRNWQGWPAVVAFSAALAFPVLAGDPPSYLLGMGTEMMLVVVVIAFAVFAATRPDTAVAGDAALLFGAHAAGAVALCYLPEAVAVGGAAVAEAAPGTSKMLARIGAAPGFWALALLAWLLAWQLVSRLAVRRGRDRGQKLVLTVVVPLLFGIWILFLWEVLVRGFAVPFVLLPPPSAIAATIADSTATLLADFRQTFLKAVLAGYAIGCLSGFLVAIVADRFVFLKRGLLPIGNLVAALPIIGIAPIMVMWFGFDWHSKAAVVAVMTFFPMLVNTVVGLSASETMQRDLMHTYAANYRQELSRLRLPAGLPFVFNALKINSTLALIGAIVAEFFGTPVVGMGFRISTEVGRMNIDMVWAEIAVAALAGSVFYGIVALIERVSTFWHPSFRHSLMEA
jgi:NitT/TauT family transport system permease protein